MVMKTKILLDSCPRCKGDLFLDHDDYGWYWQCLQCGYILYLEELKPGCLSEQLLTTKPSLVENKPRTNVKKGGRS